MTNVLVEKVDGVACVELRNPPLNVLTAEIRSELIEITRDLGVDSEVRAVVLYGSGKAFSAGSDVREFPHDEANGRTRARLEHECAHALERLPQPVIAALHGHVLGGGLELALACDLRIAETTTRIGLPEIELGVFPSGGGTYRLPRLVGPARAKQLVLLGTILDAHEAERIGLVDQLVDESAGRRAALDLARRIADKPARATRAIKRAMNTNPTNAADIGDPVEEQLIAELFTSYDAREGVAAFLEKREPRFEHR